VKALTQRRDSGRSFEAERSQQIGANPIAYRLMLCQTLKGVFNGCPRRSQRSRDRRFNGQLVTT